MPRRAALAAALAVPGAMGLGAMTLGAAGLTAAGLTGATRAGATPARPVVRIRGATAPMPAITRRSQWGPQLSSGDVPTEDVRFLLVHHTASPGSDYDPGDVPRLLSGIHGYHTGTKGWPDIAYNFFVDRFGGIWEGRAGSVERPLQGSATGGNQGFSQLCCFLGDFDAAAPPPPALAAMYDLLAWLADRDGIDTSPGATTTFVSRGSNLHPAGTTVRTPTIAAHRDMSQTSCPGDACYALVHSTFPAEVNARRSPAATVTQPTEPPNTEPHPTDPPATAPPPTDPPVSEPPTTTAPATSVPSTTELGPEVDRLVETASGPEPGGSSGVAPVAIGVGVAAVAVAAGFGALSARRNRVAAAEWDLGDGEGPDGGPDGGPDAPDDMG